MKTVCILAGCQILAVLYACFSGTHSGCEILCIFVHGYRCTQPMANGCDTSGIFINSARPNPDILRVHWCSFVVLSTGDKGIDCLEMGLDTEA